MRLHALLTYAGNWRVGPTVGRCNVSICTRAVEWVPSLQWVCTNRIVRRNSESATWHERWSGDHPRGSWFSWTDWYDAGQRAPRGTRVERGPPTRQWVWMNRYDAGQKAPRGTWVEWDHPRGSAFAWTEGTTRVRVRHVARARRSGDHPRRSGFVVLYKPNRTTRLGERHVGACIAWEYSHGTGGIIPSPGRIFGESNLRWLRPQKNKYILYY